MLFFNKNISLLFVFCSSILLSSFTAWSRPPESQNYIPVMGGESDISEGAYVDGSSRKGGLQPDYYVDFQHEAFRHLREFSADLKSRTDLSVWEKTQMIQEYLRNAVFTDTVYDDPVYLDLLRQFRNTETQSIDESNIPLSQYLIKQKGVCREHAIVLHFALKLAGIENKHVYAKVESTRTGPLVLENHAFVTVVVNGSKWVIDSYFQEFNGFLYEDLIQDAGIENVPENRRAPFAIGRLGFRKIRTVLSYPIIWMPKR